MNRVPAGAGGPVAMRLDPPPRQFWWRLSLLERYILNEILPLLAGGLVMVVVLWIFGALFQAAGSIIGKGAPVLLVLQYLALHLPEAFSRGLPLALLFAVLMSMTRLTQDSELKAAIVGGISPNRLAAPVLAVGLIVAVLSFINSEALVPRGDEQGLRVFKDIILSNPRVLVQAGQFFKDSQNQVIYVAPNGIKDGGRLENITVIQAVAGAVPLSVTRAPRGQILKEEGAIRLENGTRVTYRNGDPRPVTTLKFERATVPIKDLQQGASLSQEPRNLALPTLWERINQYRAQGLRVHAEETALHRKFAEPAAAIAFALFGVGMALFTLRSNQSLGFVGVMFLTFFYYATWSVFKAVGENGAVWPVIAAWGPDIVYAGAGLGLLILARRR
jgi:lipopolysaccharide export system permease protein